MHGARGAIVRVIQEFGNGVVAIKSALSPWAAIYSAIVAASCLELKDKLHGCQWDWIDWACTVLGGIIAMSFWLIV